MNEKARRRVDEAEKGKRNLAEESFISTGAAPAKTDAPEAVEYEASSTGQMDSSDAKDVELPIDRPQKQVAAIKQQPAKNQPTAPAVELNAV